MLTEMDAMDAFATTVSVPALTSLSQISAVLDSVGLFGSTSSGAQGAEKDRVMRALEQAGIEQAARDGRWAVGVKRLLGVCEMCRQDGERAGDKLVAELVGLML